MHQENIISYYFLTVKTSIGTEYEPDLCQNSQLTQTDGYNCMCNWKDLKKPIETFDDLVTDFKDYRSVKNEACKRASTLCYANPFFLPPLAELKKLR